MAKGGVDSQGNIVYPFQFSGGVNALLHPIAIQDNQQVKAANVFPDESGIIMKRPGVQHVALIDNQTGVDPYKVSYNPLNMHLPDANALSYNYLMQFFLSSTATGADLGERIQLFNADLAHYDARPSIATGSNRASDPVSVVNYANKTLVVGTQDIINETLGVALDGFHYWRASDTGGVSDFNATFVHVLSATDGVPANQTQSIPVKPRVACTYQGRVWYFNFGPGMGHWAVAADANTPSHTNNSTQPVFTVVGNDVLAFNGRHIELDASGENIVLAREIMLMVTGSPAQSALLVVTAEGSCFIGTGDLPETFENSTDPSAVSFVPTTLVFQKVNYKVGCAAAATMVHTPYGYIWADGNDVWVLSGNIPLKIGTLIGSKLAEYPPDARKWWSAAYVDYKYVLQCVSARGSDDRFLQREQWWLDLTQGLPQHSLTAKWFGPMSIERDTSEDTHYAALGGIITDRDGQRVLGLCSDQGYSSSNFYGLSLIDYTSGSAGPDITFRTVTEGLEWQPNIDYTVGDIVRGGFYKNTGALLYCSTSGTSGILDPAIFVTPGSGAVIDGGSGLDGTAAWTEISAELYKLITTNYDNESIRNAIDIKTKEFILGRPEVDKVLRAADLLAFTSLPQQITARVIKNQGAVSSTGDYNYLAAMFGQDINGFKGGVSQGDVASIAHGQLEGKSLRPLEGNIQRFKSLQLELFDGEINVLHPTRNVSGPYVIDSSCNSIVFGFYNDSNRIQLFQSDISLRNDGRLAFANIEALYAFIEAVMNDTLIAGGSFPAHGGGQVTVGGSPFTYVAPNTSGNAYFNYIKCQASAKAAKTGWAFFFGDSNAVAITDNHGNSGTYDLLKSKRLMAMIGLSTEQTAQARANLNGLTLPANLWFSPITSAAEGLTGGALKIYAKQIVPYTTSSDVRLAECVLRARTTMADPLSFFNR